MCMIILRTAFLFYHICLWPLEGRYFCMLLNEEIDKREHNIQYVLPTLITINERLLSEQISSYITQEYFKKWHISNSRRYRYYFFLFLINWSIFSQYVQCIVHIIIYDANTIAWLTYKRRNFCIYVYVTYTYIYDVL